MQQDFEHLFSAMHKQLQQPQPVVDAKLCIDLVNLIRPVDTRNTQEIQDKIAAFKHALFNIPHAAEILHNFLLKLFNQYQQTSLYAETGILSQDGFWNQLLQRMGAHILPLLHDDRQLQDLVRRVFYKYSDQFWIAQISNQDWHEILALLLATHSHALDRHKIHHELLHAIIVLSYRISSISIHPEFSQALPDMAEYSSPFLVQNRDLIEFVEKYRKYDNSSAQVTVMPQPSPDQAMVMLDQCRNILLRMRRSTKRNGVSLNLTYLLTLLEQCLDRIELLLPLVQDNPKQCFDSISTLIVAVTKSHYSEKSIRALLSMNSELIALQVTENASRTGGQYVSTDKRGLIHMFKSAAGAGAIIATMATLKTLAARLTMAPLLQALVYSMNYSFGFMLIHVLNFTVATKQPAMTAAALAASVQHSKGSKTTQLAELAALIINIMRTQLAAILGNISVAIPVAACIALLWQWNFGEPLMTPVKANKTLFDLNPFISLALPHAAIAGVCLFLSGLIAGYFDNMAVYRKIGARIKAHAYLQVLMGQQRLSRFADYIEHNLGALAGNLLFGVMLGSMSTLGFILGLPLDIRHIAFASANFIQALMNINGSPDIGLILVSFLGVLLIGVTNLFVSFSLTIIVALRARQVHFEQWKPLVKLVLTHFSTRPSDFFWPPKQPLEVKPHTAQKD